MTFARMPRVAHLLLSSLLPLCALAAPRNLVVDPVLAGSISQRNLQGVFIAYDAATDRWLANDAARAEEPFLPASTFKIPNSLISLESGAIASVDEILPWDRRDRGALHGTEISRCATRFALPLSGFIRNSRAAPATTACRQR